MASEAEVESLLAELLRSGAGEGDGGIGALGLQPILVGLMGPRPADGETDPPPPDRVVLMNPRTGRVVILQSDASMMLEFLMEGGGRRGPPPASKASIEAMRKVDPVDLKPDEECSVCLGEIGGGVESEQELAAREMPCKHRFHEGCINKWLGMHGSCPMCRFQMPAEEEAAAKKSEEPPRGEVGEEDQRQPRMMMSISISMLDARPQGPDDDDDDDDDDSEHQQRRMENVD